MSTAFAVLPASTSVPIDAAGKGSASFTVTNQTGSTVRVRVLVTPAGDLAAPTEWLTPPEVTERDLAADGAQQFTVLVNVPPRSAAGSYGFRLDAVSTRLPDEEWGQSPLVQFVVPEPLPEPIEEPDTPKPAAKGYVETAAGALLGGFAGGVGVGLVGALALFVAAELPSGPGSGDPFQDFLDALGTILVLAFLVVILTGLALWIGAAVGVFMFLRARGFAEPQRTALPTAVLLPIWAVVVVFLITRLPDFDLPTIVSLIVVFVVGALIVVVPALIGRAIFRFRTTGGL
ncbi:MAG TPA: hypothetical protein VEX62_04155 [Candidatus Limnocylindrales bacterium]|nr:hypothetical protein [Candidatus Limnocylindrales bacterium]